MPTPNEREEQRKQDRKREFDRQVAAGSLVVRQMTPEEREKYAESPQDVELEAGCEAELGAARERRSIEHEPSAEIADGTSRRVCGGERVQMFPLWIECDCSWPRGQRLTHQIAIAAAAAMLSESTPSFIGMRTR